MFHKPSQRRCHNCPCSTAIAVSVSFSPPREDPTSQPATSLTPKSAASLRSEYIKQIKELHELLDLEAIQNQTSQDRREDPQNDGCLILRNRSCSGLCRTLCCACAWDQPPITYTADFFIPADACMNASVIQSFSLIAIFMPSLVYIPLFTSLCFAA